MLLYILMNFVCGNFEEYIRTKIRNINICIANKCMEEWDERKWGRERERERIEEMTMRTYTKERKRKSEKGGKKR